MNDSTRTRGMSKVQARTLEYGIIGLCLLALALIFQPFSLALYGVGAGLVVVAGLAFNLVPHCVPGRSFASVARVGMIVLIVFAVALALAIGSAYLYVAYLERG